MDGWIDASAQLTHHAFAGEEGEVIARAQQAGLSACIVPGANEQGSADAVAVARKWPGFAFATVGVHPQAVGRCGPFSMGRLRTLAAEPEVVAIGLCGLDYDAPHAAPDLQRHWFEAQLALAAELQLPVLLTERGARQDFLAMVADYRAHLPAAILAEYRDDADALADYLALDLHLGVGRLDSELVRVLKQIPDDRLVAQTQAPFAGHAEPADLRRVMVRWAELRDTDVTTLGAQTAQNARAAYGLP